MKMQHSYMHALTSYSNYSAYHSMHFQSNHYPHNNTAQERKRIDQNVRSLESILGLMQNIPSHLAWIFYCWNVIIDYLRHNGALIIRGCITFSHLHVIQYSGFARGAKKKNLKKLQFAQESPQSAFGNELKQFGKWNICYSKIFLIIYFRWHKNRP